uniref:HMA domain-containing protein n=1 Tax=Chrysotila carterae TaxID=13221 RepID=A0A7S4BZJ4_CHRCT
MTWLRVKGMVCGHCTGRVQQALEAAAGVDSVVVTLEPPFARIHGAAGPNLLVQIVSDAGFEATHLPHTLLAVEGMMCDHCRGKVQRALEAVLGVEAVHVDLALKQASVAGQTAPEALVAAVETIGFGARVADDHVVMDLEASIIDIGVELTSQTSRLRGAQETQRLNPVVDEEDCSSSSVQHKVEVSARLLELAARGGACSTTKQPNRRRSLPMSVVEAILIAVEGMTCDKCRGLVESQVSALSGVISVTVSTMAKRAQARMLARDEGSSSHGSAAAEASMWRRQSVGSVFFAVPIFVLAIVGPRSPAPCSTPFLSTPSPLPSSLSPPPPQHTRVRVRHRRLSPSRPPPPTLSAYLFDEILYKLTVLLAFSLSFFSPPSSSPSQSLCFLLCLSPTLSPSLPISLLFLRVLLLHFLFVLARTRCHERRRGLTARVAATLDKYSRISPLRNSQHVFVCSSWYPVHAVLA